MSLNNANSFLNQTFFLRLLLQRLLGVYLCMALLRAIFYLYNHSFFSQMPTSEWLGAWFWGLRFDTVAILYVNSFFVLISLLPTIYRVENWYKFISAFIFVGTNAGLFFLEMADVGYFPFSLRRLVKSDFDMQQDFFSLLPQFLSEFWWLLAIGITMLYFLYKLHKVGDKKTVDLDKGLKFYLYQFAILVFFSAWVVLGMRGGWQVRPITAMTASQYVGNAQHAALVSNSTINLIHSFGQVHILAKNYLPEAELGKYPVIQTYKPNPSQPFKKMNVVVLIIESYGQEYIHHFNPQFPPLTPFFDSLCRKGLLFPNAHANGTRSTQGVAAITAGFPALMQDPFMFSAYQNNKLSSIATYLSSKGYETFFSHPATDGSMFFDTYSRLVNYKNYLGRRAYETAKGKINFDGGWGIYDLPFYDFLLENLNQSQQPFFCTHFSINPHHPYNLPDTFKQKYQNEQGEYAAIRYADFALQHFFAQAQKQSWYENTLFVITADHIGAAFDPKYALKSQRYRIPLILFSPKDSLLRGTSPRLAQQVDILPTVLNYLHFDQTYQTFGRDLLDSSANFQNFVCAYDNGLYQILSDSLALHFDGEKSTALYEYQTDFLQKNDILGENLEKSQLLENQLKATIQIHNDKLLKNKLP